VMRPFISLLATRTIYIMKRTAQIAEKILNVELKSGLTPNNSNFYILVNTKTIFFVLKEEKIRFSDESHHQSKQLSFLCHIRQRNVRQICWRNYQRLPIEMFRWILQFQSNSLANYSFGIFTMMSMMTTKNSIMKNFCTDTCVGNEWVSIQR
jgi:hypothetical protein